MEKFKSISEYFSRTLTLVNQMKANGETIRDQQIIEKVLRTFTLQFEYIVKSIEEPRDLSTTSVDELMGSLQKREKGKRDKSFGQKCSNVQAKIASSSSIGDEADKALLFMCDIAVENQKNVWYLDTGCSNHMCGVKELFSKLDGCFRSEVKFRNNSEVPIMGKGTISIKAKDGCPTKGLEQLKTPVEVWSDQTPSVNHLRVFGCIAYVRVPDELRKKLDDKSEKCIFLDYSDVTKGQESVSGETSSEEASQDEGWIQAMDDEIHVIEKNDTWELTPLPEGKKSIGVKSVYKMTYKPNGDIDMLEAHLLVKGYNQKLEIDYFELKGGGRYIKWMSSHHSSVEYLTKKCTWINGGPC
ncbi:hypothetical protein CRG98_007375 [Punica granatum]|uniref:Reverse transcriptase Ty1/copia-type domain-containing protein n=1 Tax=Punica granatum TaxID=22663 RepID=A0A2I0KUU1_PUNGR|nr:hypothetical protein CRG98_007375 [Punica granatum]